MEVKINKLHEWLKKNQIDYIKDFNLAIRSWIKAGGKIRTFIKPKNIKQIKKLIKYFNQIKIHFYLIGNISNTIIRDGNILTPFVNLSHLKKIKKKETKNGLILYVEAGVPIPVFSKFVVNQGYSGAEGLYGIPGTMGGGIFMNASSFGDSLSKYIHKIISIDLNQNIIIDKKQNTNFAWRFSEFQKNENLIVGAYFYFPKENKSNVKEIDSKLNKFLNIRKKFQEKENPNLGSLFATKNIYSDLKFISFSYLLLYLFNKLVNLIFFRAVFKKYLFNIRSFVNYLYFKKLKLDKNSKFSLSNKTANCLINKGTSTSLDGIKLIRKF